MLSILAVFGYVAALMASGLCCLPKEYAIRGKCCPMCHKGTFVWRDCTPQSGTRCIPCVNGTFMNHPNGAKKCVPCTSCDQGHGHFAKQACTATTNTICDVLSGHFCRAYVDDKGCSSAQKHTPCLPGHRMKVPGTSRTDTVCEPCQPGYFLQDGLNCAVWTICSGTQVKVKEGSSSSDVVCGRKHFCYIPLYMVLLLIIALAITGKIIFEKKKETGGFAFYMRRVLGKTFHQPE